MRCAGSSHAWTTLKIEAKLLIYMEFLCGSSHAFLLHRCAQDTNSFIHRNGGQREFPCVLASAFRGVSAGVPMRQNSVGCDGPFPFGSLGMCDGDGNKIRPLELLVSSTRREW